MTMIANLLALALIVADEPPEPWNLTLNEAIRIGVINSEVVRVISLEPPGMPLYSGPTPLPMTDPANPSDLTIAPLDGDVSIWNFQADVMAHVRSIEQQYWALWLAQAALKAREDAVREGEEALARERSELEESGRGSLAADIAEAKRRVGNLKLEMMTVISDLITAERQLRNILGLPASDNRRIIAATPPIEAKVAPDWELSRRAMLGSRPEIVQQRVVTRLIEMQLLQARNQLLPLMGMNALYEFTNLGGMLDEAGPGLADLIRRNATRGYPAGLDPSAASDPEFISRQVGLVIPMTIGFGRSPLPNTRQTQYRLLQQKAALRWTIDQSTETLVRFFEAIEAEHDQFEAAHRLTDEAGKRLEAQRAFFEEGRISIDRLLDAIARHADAVAAEAEHLAEYNTAIAAFEESKGTLLAHETIAIVDRPRPRKAYVQAKDQEIAPASFEKPAGVPDSLPAPAPPAPVGKTFKLKAKLGPGGLDLDIEVHEGPTAPPASP